MEVRLRNRLRTHLSGLVLICLLLSNIQTPAGANATNRCRIVTRIGENGSVIASQKCSQNQAATPPTSPKPLSKARTGNTPRTGSNSTRTNTSRTTNAAARNQTTRNQTTRNQTTRNQATRTGTTRPVVPLGRGDYRYVNGRLLYFANQLSTSRYNVVGPLPASVAPTTPAARRTSATPTPTPRTPTPPRTPTVVATPVAPIDPFQLATETLEQHPLPPPEPHIPPFQAIAGVPLELTINGATEPTFQLLATNGDPNAADPITYACNPSTFDISWGDGEQFTTARRALHTHIWQNRGRADLTITANWTCQYRIESTLQTGTLTTSTQFTQPIPVREVQPVLIDAP